MCFSVSNIGSYVSHKSCLPLNRWLMKPLLDGLFYADIQSHLIRLNALAKNEIFQLDLFMRTFELSLNF